MAFAQLVQPDSRFQLGLDELLPILDSNKAAVSDFTDPIRVIDLFYPIASLADFSLIYSVFALRASSCHGQPLQVATFGFGRLLREREKVIGIGNGGGVTVSPDAA